ncbi:hypothetical protein V8F06_009461 [Rhypophila decipiens]
MSVPADAKILNNFEREIQSLKRLRHRHIVKLVGSYTDRDLVGLIIDPVGDMDLGEFLGHAKMDSVLRKRQLRPFFGCLATALAYLHQKDVRHNDIKPQNILVKDSQVYLTDFGMARTWNKNGHSTTIGNHERGTPPYYAPELIHGQQMAKSLAGYSTDDFESFYKTHGTCRFDRLAANGEATELWMREIGSRLSKHDAKALDWVKWMMKYEMDDRPSPMRLRAEIIDTSDEGSQTFICAACSSPEGLDDEKNGDIHQPQPVAATDLGRFERESSLAQRAMADVPFPTASLVPSYILAGTNHLSHTAVEDTQRYNPLAVNLFVYGRLMFPGILHSVAAASLEGAYAPKLRRRLYPTTGDWARADVSIKSASDNRTPARLLGYDRWRPRGLNCAVAQEVRFTERIVKQCSRLGPAKSTSEMFQPPGNVTGFLVLRLRSDALRYCDLLLQSDVETLWRMAPPTDDDDDDRDNRVSHDRHDSSPLLERRKFEVEVELDYGSMQTIGAETYVWSHGTRDLVDLWNEDRFVRSTVMTNCWHHNPTGRLKNSSLQVVCTWSSLCAIMSGDIPALAGLLEDRHFSPDSPCRRYGLPLHAAVVAGRDDMVRLLISQKANLDASSGLYGTPLIAAAIHGRIIITKTLLHQGVNVLASHRVHINALYQAVSHVKYALTEMLLEHGARLSTNWGEILDLADGLGADGADIQKLLSLYDVRGRTRPARRRRVAKIRSAMRDRRRQGRRLDDVDEMALVRQAETSWDMVQYSEVGTSVIRRLATVMQMPYNWRGRRAVELTVAALDAGAPLDLIQLIRMSIHPVKAILDMLRQSDGLHQKLDSLSLGSSRLIQGVDGGYGKDSDSDSETSSGRRCSRDSTPDMRRERNHGARHMPSISTRADGLSLSHSRPPSHFRMNRSPRTDETEDNGERRAHRSRASSVHSAPRQDYNHLSVPGLEASGSLRRSVSAREARSPHRRRED